MLTAEGLAELHVSWEILAEMIMTVHLVFVKEEFAVQQHVMMEN